LFPVEQFLIAQIVALHLDQVERDQFHVMIAATAPQSLEIGQPVIPANNGFTIDQERLRPDRAGCLHDGGKPIGPIMPAAREQAHARASTAHHEPEAIVFNLMYPLGAGRRPGSPRRAARFHKPGRPGGATLTQQHGRGR
jgi:hypothetical protein